MTLKNQVTYHTHHLNILGWFFLVFDDLVGDPHTYKESHSAINDLCIKHKHLQCNLLFTTQNIKAIQLVLCCNLDIFVIFKFANVQFVVEKIYRETSTAASAGGTDRDLAATHFSKKIVAKKNKIFFKF